MQYFRATYDFESLIVPLLIERAWLILSFLTGNVLFPTPTVGIPALKQSITDLQDAWIAYENNPGPSERDALNAIQNELNGKLKADADYVSSISGGDAKKISSGGYTPTKEKVKKDKNLYDVVPGSEPTNLDCYYKKAANEASVVWAYYKKQDPPILMDPNSLKATTKDNFELTGLVSGAYYCVMAAPVKTKTDGSLKFMKPITVLVP
jgi:hypothetical protein